MFRRSITLVTAVSIAALLVAPPCGFADADESASNGFHLSVDPVTLMPIISDVDTNSSKFDEYADRSSGMTVPELDLYGNSADGNRTFTFLGSNLMRDDARYTMVYRQSGSYRLTVDHNLIPHRFGNGATLLWTETAPGVYEVSDSVQNQLQADIEKQRAASASGVNFAFLNRLIAPHLASASRIDIGLERRRTAVTLDLARMQEWSSTIVVKREERDGSRPYGGSFGFSNATELPEPIDYDTTSADASVAWRGKRAGLEAGYRYSHFQNNVQRLLYDNPFRATDSTSATAYSAPGSGSIDGPAIGSNALAPSNSASTGYASARTKIGGRGWANASFQYSVMTQDEELLPYSTNRAINVKSGAPFDVTDVANLPEVKADTMVKAMTIAGNAGTAFGTGGTLIARYRHYGYDNQSQRVEFPGYVRFDAVWEDIPRVTVPYEYQRNTLEGELGWDFNRGTHFGLVYNRDMWDRTFREINTSHEDSVAVRLSHRARDWGSLRSDFRYGRRSTDEYSTAAQEESFLHPEGINNQPGLRKFDEAERKFYAGGASAQLMPSDKLELMVGFKARKDDYDRSEMGLLYDKYTQVDGELSYTPTGMLTMFAFASHNDREAFQRARQSGGTLSTNEADNWELTLEEKTSTIGAGFTASLSDRLIWKLTGNWTKADGTSTFFSPPGGTPNLAESFDEYDDNEFWNLSCSLDYSLRERIRAALGYVREAYIADRFTRDGLTPYAPGSLFLVANDGDYKANLFWGSLTFRF